MQVLILPLERGHRLALRLIERSTRDMSIPDLDILMRLPLPRERVLHPLLVVTIREVLASVGATRFFAVGGRLSGLHGAGEEVAEFEGLDQVAVPDHAAVFGADVVEHLVDFADPI